MSSLLFLLASSLLHSCPLHSPRFFLFFKHEDKAGEAYQCAFSVCGTSNFRVFSYDSQGHYTDLNSEVYCVSPCKMYYLIAFISIDQF
jgi:hypothetical protein